MKSHTPDIYLRSLPDDALVAILTTTPASRVAAMTLLSQHIEAVCNHPPSTAALQDVIQTLITYRLITPEVG